MDVVHIIFFVFVVTFAWNYHIILKTSVQGRNNWTKKNKVNTIQIVHSIDIFFNYISHPVSTNSLQDSNNEKKSLHFSHNIFFLSIFLWTSGKGMDKKSKEKNTNIIKSFNILYFLWQFSDSLHFIFFQIIDNSCGSFQLTSFSHQTCKYPLCLSSMVLQYDEEKIICT